jgi:arginase family enzyme
VELQYFFKPVSIVSLPAFDGEPEALFGARMMVFKEGKKLDVDALDVAIIGVESGVNSPGNKGCDKAPDAIRSALYGLRGLDRKLNIVDLGNIKGRTLDDKYVALKEVVLYLLEHAVIPVVIGGSQEFTNVLATAFNLRKRTWQLAVIDSRIDYFDPAMDFSSKNFLGKILVDNKETLRDVSLLGVQKYLYSAQQERIVETNQCGLYRLGNVRGENLKQAEPVLRDADVLSIDGAAVKESDNPAQPTAMPNGLLAHEICQMAWYAGLSDNMKALGLFEWNPEMDTKRQSGIHLAAQVIWHFCEGITGRYRDYPLRDIESYKIYVVHLEHYDIDIRFFNNPDNDRWWVEVPADDETVIVACEKRDYLKVAESELPEKWMRFLKKSNCKSDEKDINHRVDK